jgi:hypothetical protein
MTGVPGVLLDHVDKHVSRGHGALTVRHLAAQAVLGEGIEPCVSPGDLGLPGGEGVLHHAGVSDRAVEIPVRLVFPSSTAPRQGSARPMPAHRLPEALCPEQPHLRHRGQSPRDR